jgi:xanthine dehydrogenase accessory factor
LTTINPNFKNISILIKGAGDLATGVAARLFHAGFPVAMTELPSPTMVRRAVCFGSAVFEGEITVEDLTAARVEAEEIDNCLAQGQLPVVIDPAAATLTRWPPLVLIDAIIAKRNTGTRIDDAPLVIALGPGFSAGQDCHHVIESNRGHWLGRIISKGAAQTNTNSPGEVKGQTKSRVLRAPAAGHLTPHAVIGDTVQAGQLIAEVSGKPVLAPFDGVLRGLIHPSVAVTPGYKIGDVDPRGVREHCFTISEKSLAIGGGVLEAILASEVVRKQMIK